MIADWNGDPVLHQALGAEAQVEVFDDLRRQPFFGKKRMVLLQALELKLERGGYPLSIFFCLSCCGLT